MKNLILSILILVSTQTKTLAFCGFYVAKADATLFNKASQVILARNGEHSVITMFSDYQGPVSEFAMVVPVPSVLKREQIRTISKGLFVKLDLYTGPRLVEYHDQSPCYIPQPMSRVENISMQSKSASSWEAPERMEKKNKVVIEARYEVDEYEVLILSAKESTSLETWLNENGYRIPKGAGEVLQPYIKAGMKFFVAKVNLKKFDPNGKNELSPLQITFDSPKFMLPIRLGMANAAGDQDLIVYALTSNGRVETVNYRTAQMPTNRNIPEFVGEKFGPFYKDAFSKAWGREDKTSVLLEYAWNISGTAPMKCDPCPQTVNGPLSSLTYEELSSIGVNWVTQSANGTGPWGNGTSYMGNLFVTRLHARYNRELYPQDLVFQETANRENFQSRYVMNHPSNDLGCENAQTYLKMLVDRRNKEMMELAYLTGWSVSDKSEYVGKYRSMIKGYDQENNGAGKNFLIPFFPGKGNGPGSGNILLFVLLFLSATVVILRLQTPKTKTHS